VGRRCAEQLLRGEVPGLVCCVQVPSRGAATTHRAAHPGAAPPSPACSLFKRVEGGLQLMRQLMADHAKESGRQLVLDPEKSREPVEYVQQLLDKLDKYERIFVGAFNDDKTFRNALNQVQLLGCWAAGLLGCCYWNLQRSRQPAGMR
jgi:hypothetical protein